MPKLRTNDALKSLQQERYLKAEQAHALDELKKFNADVKAATKEQLKLREKSLKRPAAQVNLSSNPAHVLPGAEEAFLQFILPVAMGKLWIELLHVEDQDVPAASYILSLDTTGTAYTYYPNDRSGLVFVLHHYLLSHKQDEYFRTTTWTVDSTDMNSVDLVFLLAFNYAALRPDFSILDENLLRINHYARRRRSLLNERYTVEHVNEMLPPLLIREVEPSSSQPKETSRPQRRGIQSGTDRRNQPAPIIKPTDEEVRQAELAAAELLRGEDEEAKMTAKRQGRQPTAKAKSAGKKASQRGKHAQRPSHTPAQDVEAEDTADVPDCNNESNRFGCLAPTAAEPDRTGATTTAPQIDEPATVAIVSEEVQTAAAQEVSTSGVPDEAGSIQSAASTKEKLDRDAKSGDSSSNGDEDEQTHGDVIHQPESEPDNDHEATPFVVRNTFIEMPWDNPKAAAEGSRTRSWSLDDASLSIAAQRHQ